MTDYDFKEACEMLKKIGMPKQNRILFVTEHQLKKMIAEGEVVDKVNKTVNGIEYIIPHRI